MKRRRGSVIIVVLVLITLASLLLARFMEDNSLELSMATREADRRRLRADAQSELELALAVIAEIRAIDLNKIHAPTQGFDDPHAYAGFPPRDGLQVQFDYEDESAKLPLSVLTKNDLIQLLYSLGMEQRDAERVSDAVVAWQSKSYESLEEEATDAAYQRATLSFRPARRPIRSFEEFRSIGVAKEFFFDERGRPTPIFQAFKSCVSLYTFPQANINTASDAVLLSQGLDENQLALIRERQAEIGRRIVGTPPYFRVTSEVRQLIGGGANLAKFDDEIILMWVRVTVKEGLSKCRVSALVAIRDDVAYPSATANPDTNPDIGLTGRAPTATTARTTGTSTAAPRSVTRTPTPYLTPGIEPPANLGKSTMNGRVASNTIAYPFQILAWEEDNGAPPEPKPPADLDEPTAPPTSSK
ncbi:MAG: general secretion pathway protein GspK [Opitutales bacterium]